MADYTETFPGPIQNGLSGQDLGYFEPVANHFAIAGASTNLVGIANNTNKTAPALIVIGANQYAELDIEQVGSSGSGQDQVGVCVRAQQTANANCYNFYRSISATQWRLGKFIDGSFTELDNFTVSASGPQKIRLEVEGTTLRGFVNDVQRVTAVDATFDGTGTTPGLYGNSSTSSSTWNASQARFGDFGVTPPTGGLPPTVRANANQLIQEF